MPKTKPNSTNPRSWCADPSTRGVNSHVDQAEVKAAKHPLRPKAYMGFAH
jgi:hypothetical protein